MNDKDFEEVGTVELSMARELQEHNSTLKECVEELRESREKTQVVDL